MVIRALCPSVLIILVIEDRDYYNSIGKAQEEAGWESGAAGRASKTFGGPRK